MDNGYGLNPWLDDIKGQPRLQIDQFWEDVDLISSVAVLLVEIFFAFPDIPNMMTITEITLPVMECFCDWVIDLSLFRGEVPLLGCQSLRRSWASWIGRTLPGRPSRTHISLKEIKIANSNLNCRPNLKTRVNLLKKKGASPGESHSYTSLLRLALFLTLPQLMIG